MLSMLGFMYRYMDDENKPFVDTEFWVAAVSVGDQRVTEIALNATKMMQTCIKNR